MFPGPPHVSSSSSSSFMSSLSPPPDLSQHVVTDYKQALDLLEEGVANRITAATHNHEASSRSHAIFTIQYTQVSAPVSLLMRLRAL